MGAPASEDLRELERELELAQERGETLSRAAVQEMFSVGSGDADGMLDTLRTHGKAFEVSPGEWRGPTMEEIAQLREAGEPEPERVVVSVPDGDGDVDPEFAARAERLSDAIARRRGETPRADGSAPQWEMALSSPTVRLTRGIADALDADALGKLVKAGLDDADPGEMFVLEVTP